MESVLRRPFSDEIEDYREYKRIRQAARSAQQQQHAAKSKKDAASPVVTISSDGACDDMGGYFSDLSDFGDAQVHDSVLVNENGVP